MSDLCLLAAALSQPLGQKLEAQPGHIVALTASKGTKSRATKNVTNCKAKPTSPDPIAAVQPVAIHRRVPLEGSLPVSAPIRPRLALPQADRSLARRSEARSGDIRPRSGIQLYWQRMIALRQGALYTRLPIHSFYEVWRSVTGQPTYEQWRRLLTLEARAVARGRGQRGLAVLVGDSLSQWFPSDRLPGGSLWLNQGISGDTTRGILQRLQDFGSAKPDRIYVMAGVNDLKNGRSDREILQNLAQIVHSLKQRQPQAQIILQSILPTRSRLIPNARIARLNRSLATIAQQQDIIYLDLHRQFQATDGYLRSDLTTDGIHLNPQGYAVWQTAIAHLDRSVPETLARR